MASFVSFFYNRGGSCPRSQIRNRGSWLNRTTAWFRKHPGIFDQLRACRTPAAILNLVDKAKGYDCDIAKVHRRAIRHLRELKPLIAA